jgi:hypothetical protein
MMPARDLGLVSFTKAWGDRGLVSRVLLTCPVSEASSLPDLRSVWVANSALHQTLADVPGGVSVEMLVVVHGFSAEMLAGLVLAGLATVVTETRGVRRGVTIKVEHIRITDVGRRALEG